MDSRHCEYCFRNATNLVPKYREEYGQYLCWNCYTHYKEHPVNPLPPKGVIALDDDGLLICHICGRAYDKLASHLRYKHGTTQEDYKKEFGLNRTAKLISENHKQKLRKNLVQVKDIREVGKATQGSTVETNHRRGKKERLQAKINRENKKK
ncbi:MAG: MucR family transcriptional regulator [Paraclostridium sp.]